MINLFFSTSFIYLFLNNFIICSKRMTNAAYKVLVRTVTEYGNESQRVIT